MARLPVVFERELTPEEGQRLWQLPRGHRQQGIRQRVRSIARPIVWHLPAIKDVLASRVYLAEEVAQLIDRRDALLSENDQLRVDLEDRNGALHREAPVPSSVDQSRTPLGADQATKSSVGSVLNWEDPRDRFIQRHVAGRSFVDIGGLYGEKVSVAFHAGAASLTMQDIAASRRRRWQTFGNEMQALGAKVECVQGDMFGLDGTWEVVHSSGLLYHQPDPFLYLDKLHSLTERVCILTSTVAPRCIETGSGEVKVPAGAALLVPALDETERKVVGDYIAGFGFDLFHAPDGFVTSSYGPNWWLPTSLALRRMCQCAGFEVVAQEDFPPEVYPASTLVLLPRCRPGPSEVHHRRLNSRQSGALRTGVTEAD